jgi:hypothetical protein
MKYAGIAVVALRRDQILVPGQFLDRAGRRAVARCEQNV